MKTLQFFLVVLASAKNRFSFMAGIKRLPPLNILNNISSKTEEKWKAVQSCSKDLPASWSSASECLTEVKSETSYFNLLNCRPAVRRRVPGIISGAAALTWRVLFKAPFTAGISYTLQCVMLWHILQRQYIIFRYLLTLSKANSLLCLKVNEFEIWGNSSTPDWMMLSDV